MQFLEKFWNYLEAFTINVYFIFRDVVMYLLQ